MNMKMLIVAGLAGTIFLAGCRTAPPPPPAPAPTESAVDAEALRAEEEARRAAAEAERLAALQQRVNEVFVPVYFAFDQSALTGKATESLGKIGALMKENERITVVIEGHTDERGTNEYNLALGERRALAVRDYLVSYGINGSRLSVLSYGEEKPAVQGSNEEAWSKNRRAEFRPSF